MSSKLFAICGVAVGLIAGFLGGRVSKSIQVVTKLPPVAPESRVITDVSPKVELTESPSSRIAIVEPAPVPDVEAKEPTVEEALASLDRALRNQPIGDGTDAEFERKYRGVSLAAAREAMLLLHSRFEKEQTAILAQRWAEGQIVERRADDGLGSGERSFGRGGGSAYFAQEMGSDGVMVTRSTGFDFVEYPALHAVQLEAQYLQGMMRIPMPPGARSPR